MDGSYLRPDGRGQPSLPTQSTGTSGYKTNVNRSKTKKWVEAKSQNYDGDDWGAEEYDDEDGDPEPPLPKPPMAQDQLPSQRAASQTYSQHAGPVPPLEVHTQQPSAHNITSPVSDVSGHSGSFHPVAGQSVVSPTSASTSANQSFGADRDPTSTTSAHQEASTGKPSSFVRPSDIYKRLEAERERERLSSDGQRPPTDSLVGEQARNRSASPIKAPVPQPTSQHASTGRQPPAPQPHTPRQFESVGNSFEVHELDSKRISVSPKLPDLARMSTFGPDLFDTPPDLRSAPPLPGQALPTQPEEPEGEDFILSPPVVEPHVPVASNVSSDKSTTGSEPSKRSTESASAVPQPLSQETPESENVVPLRTSSVPSEPHRDVTPTEPLHLRKGSSPLQTVEPEPKPIGRQPTFGTDTSSPVKESDALREEIMRSLSPAAPEQSSQIPDNPQTGKSMERKGTRDSTYTLQDYDTYWADADEKPPLPQAIETPTSTALEPVHEDEPTTAEPSQMDVHKTESLEKQAPAAEVPRAETTVPIIQEPIMAEPVMAEPIMAEPVVADEAKTQTSGVNTGAVVGASAAVGVTGATAVVAANSASSNPKQNLRRRFSWEDAGPEDDIPKQPAPATMDDAAVTNNDAERADAAPKPDRSVDHSAFNAPTIAVAPADTQSGLPGYEQHAPAAEATRGSMVSDGAGAPIEREESRLSLADEKALAETSSTSLVAPSPPPEAHPALSDPASSPKPNQPVMTFREIMDLGATQDRIKKFNEARVSFATSDVGLHQWLVTLQSEHPEHLPRSTAANGTQGDGLVTGGATGPQPTVQQPYYQQYLNASSPSSQSPTSRSRIAGLSIPSAGGSSSFGHSSNQIGTKSKDLLQSAGKMGKGLLSKGKNKFRGSGDKGESASSPMQPRITKADRRGSWALNLGSKTKTDEAVNQTQRTQPVHVSRTDPAPQLPVPEPVSPFTPESTDTRTSAWPPPPIPQPAQSKSGLHGAGKQMPAPQLQSLTDDWVMVARDERPPVPSKSPVESSTNRGALGTLQPPDLSTAAAFPATASLSGTDDAPKRQSSFVGLPPIRRTSTFGLSKAKKAKQRFPLDGDDDDDSRSPFMGQTIPEQEATEADLSDDSRQGEVMMVDHTQSNVAQEKKEPVIVQTEVQSAQEAAQPPQSTITPQRNDQSHSSVHSAIAGHQQSKELQHDHQVYHQAMDPLQRVPPAGPWKLEESHLSEPLNVVARNKSGTGGSQTSPVFYGFDKETGLPNTIPPSAQHPPSPPKPKSPELPPSSAQRYPSLFAPQPGQPNQGEPDYRSGQVPYHEALMNPRRISSEYSIPGVGPPTDEGGRSRRNSGTFRDIGNRIVRAVSRERRGSTAGQSQPMQNMQGEDYSGATMAQEDTESKRKRRSSLFMSLGGRASMDQELDRPPPVGIQRAQTDMVAPRPGSQSDGRKSFLGGLASVQQKFASAGPRQSFTTNRMSESTEDVTDTTPKKKRFSDLSKVFRRSQHPDQPSESHRGSLDASGVLSGNHGVSRADQYAADDVLGSQRSPDQPTSSFDMMPPSGPPKEHSSRGRRGSVSDFLTNLVGRKTDGKQSEHGLHSEASMITPQNKHEGYSFSNIPQPPTEKLHSRPHSGSMTPEAAEPGHRRVSQHLAAPTGSRPTSFGRDASPDSRVNLHNEPQQLRRPLSFEQHEDSERSFTAARFSQDQATNQHASTTADDQQPTNLSAQSQSSVAHAQHTNPEQAGDREEEQPGATTMHQTKSPVDDSPSIVSRQDTEEAVQSPAVHSPSVSSVQSSFKGYPGPPGDSMVGQYGAHRAHGAQYRQPPKLSQQQWQQYPARVPISSDPPSYGGQRPSMPYQTVGASSSGPGDSRGQYVPPYQQTHRPSFDHQQKVSEPQSGKTGESRMSKLKGIRNRMSEHMSTIAQSGGARDDKVDSSGKGDRLSGTKLLGAFKRSSKQVEPSAFNEQARHPGHNAQMQQGSVQHPPPSVSRPPYDVPSQRRTMTMQEYQAQQSPTRYAEPQYDAVPIPQGYSAVRSDGGNVPSQHQTSGQMYQTGSYSAANDQQQRLPHLQYAQEPQQPQHMHIAQPQVQPVKRNEYTEEMIPSPPSADQPHPPAFNRGPDDELSPIKSDSSNAGLSREQSERELLQPGGGLTVKRTSSEHSQVSAVSAAPGHQQTTDGQPDLSINTELQPSPSSANAVTEPGPAEPERPSEEKRSDEAGEGSSDSRPGTAKASAVAQTKQSGNASRGFAAELDDTEDAHKRTMRMASQEEKIYYNPEDDAEPTMSATSYPGDEWNPYGEVAYGDWRED